MEVLADYVTRTFDVGDEKVTIKKLSSQDEQEIAKMQNLVDAGIESVLRSVVKWTFTVNGSPLAVTRENIARIRADIITTVGIEVAKFNNYKNLEKPAPQEPNGEN